MSTYIYGSYEDYKVLKVVIRSRKDNNEYVHAVVLDKNELVTEENTEVWSRYLTQKIESLVSPEAMKSAEFRKIAENVKVEMEREEKWKAGAAERERRERHRRQLRRTPTLGFIPDGLTIDYSTEYGRYVEYAIEWTPDDSDDFLYQLRSLERMCTKCVQRCLENNRPDAAFAQSLEVCRHLPIWKSRKDLSCYFDKYLPRLRKFVKVVYQGMVDSAIAWNHADKLKEANELIAAHQEIFLDWGVKPKKMLELCSQTVLEGLPVEVTRTPSKAEMYEIRQEELRKEAEVKRKAEEEAERNSLIPANKTLEKSLFIDRRLNWECSFIGYAIDEQGKQVSALLEAGMAHDAIILFLQIVKYMCKHFVNDEHWAMFDDMYDPDYSCDLIARNLNEAAKDGKLSAQDIEYFHQAWQEIQSMEACWNYGIANYKFGF